MKRSSRLGRCVRLFFYVGALLVIAELTVMVGGQFYFEGGLNDTFGKALRSGRTPVRSKTKYISHPYFGNVYKPNSVLFENNHRMQSNSEGFIDDEFPTRKKKGLCFIGLFGGSGAMSWGAVAPSARIDAQLEKILNRRTSKRCSKIEVLNFGIGGHHQYQATQVFLYYQHLLDGAIFYVGNNECSHPLTLNRGRPFRYPVHEVSRAPLFAQKVFRSRKRLSAHAEIFLKYPALSLSNLSKLVFLIHSDSLNSQIRKWTKLSQRSSFAPSSKNFRILGTLQQALPKIRTNAFLYATRSQTQAQVLERTLPLIYTRPLRQAYQLASKNGIFFLSVIQPLPGPLGMVKKYPFHALDFECIRVLRAESEKLRKEGVNNLDLNDPRYFSSAKKDIFLDGIHLTTEGNTFVSNVISASILKGAPF